MRAWVIQLPRCVVISLVVSALAVWGTVGYLVGGGSGYTPHLIYVPVVLALVTVLVSDRAGAAERRQDTFDDHDQWIRTQTEAIVQAVSHDFRTPLTVIAGGAQTLSTHGLVDDRGKDVVDALLRSTRRLEALVYRVLAAAGDVPDSTAQQVVSIEDLLARAIPADCTDGSERVTTTVAHGASSVVTRPVILAALLSILLDNAFKFSPPGSPVEVRVTRKHGVVVIEVVDHGSGIGAEDLERVFRPFEQANHDVAQAKGGLGLGLVAARRLASRLGASLALLPGQDGGTVARVELPQRRQIDLAAWPNFDHDDDDVAVGRGR